MIAEQIKQRPFAFPLKPYKPFIAPAVTTIQELLCRKYQGLSVPKNEAIERIIKAENKSLRFDLEDGLKLREWLSTLAGSQWFPSSAMTQPEVSCRYSAALQEVMKKANDSVSRKDKLALGRIVSQDKEALQKTDLFNGVFALDYGTFDGENHEGEYDKTAGIFINASCGVTAYKIPLNHFSYKHAIAITGWLRVVTQDLEFHLMDDDSEDYYCGELPEYKEKYNPMLQEAWRTNTLPDIATLMKLVNKDDMNFAEYEYGKTFDKIDIDDQKELISRLISYWLRKMMYNDTDKWSIKDVNALENRQLRKFLKQSYAFYTKKSHRFANIFTHGFGHVDPNHMVQPHFGDGDSLLDAFEFDLTDSAHRSMMEGDEYGVYTLNFRHPHIKEYLLCRAAGAVFIQHLITYLPE